MEKNGLKLRSRRPGNLLAGAYRVMSVKMGPGLRPAGTTIVLFCLVLVGLSSCNWKVKPTYPANRVADSLRHLCSHDYKIPVEVRHEDKTLQAVVWKVSLFGGRSHDLQGMRKEAADTMEHVFLCATRVALSTDAPLDFIEVKMADVLTGATVTLWRYVPDIRDSMYQRIGDTEYFNRLVIEIEVDKRSGSATRKSIAGLDWDRPITFSEFLAKQIISRARREGGESFEAHADLTTPATLDVVMDNWSSIEEDGPARIAKVTDSVHKSAQAVVKGYRFSGFHGITMRDSQGVAIGSWTL